MSIRALILSVLLATLLGPVPVRTAPAREVTRATLAKPGAMFVSQPEIPVPLAVEFPFPAWATRLSECAAPPRAPAASQGDVFARLPAVDDDIPPF